VFEFIRLIVANMNKPHKKKAAIRQDQLLSHTTKRKTSIDEARAHLFGVCLLDASCIQYLPACFQLSYYGKFTLTMIKQGVGLEAIVRHLEAYGLHNAQDVFKSALKAVPDNADLSRLFFRALTVVSSHE